ncbi:TIGR03067 domain-containing protein [Roseiconus nitratireducens]|uniref:TIGR03067 domain-containing protein n=1 Tax=Roseiconus nitratireducens TaxID=2605748 RepID=A0A5M6DGV7_9BACT|nr:TIGR03067 domain-containing protein [Roseiconus nitratireducens]KAA5545439.1 TIGR03067 domain-containing protein [Roseiconus nitratireducens]
MRATLFGMFLVTVAVGSATAADDFHRLEGTWQVDSLTINGNEAKPEDAHKLTVVNGNDGRWSIRSEGKEISHGTSTLDPTRKPKSIDFKPTEGGGQGNRYEGIYQIKKKTRQLCFVPPGHDRPDDFSSAPGSQRILVKFKRLEPAAPLTPDPTKTRQSSEEE